ncbi:AMP-binding protein, partial [Sinorhizobium meliloti]|nr:AMP-binding protein [Sinorhizobium meliloti]
TEADYPSDLCVHALFEAQVRRAPDAVALVFEEQSISYGALNADANRLAHHLIGLGVRPTSQWRSASSAARHGGGTAGDPQEPAAPMCRSTRPIPANGCGSCSTMPARG